jgi:hypothetical protein
MYTWQVNFSKQFVEGHLKGRIYHDYLRFCTKADALFFAKRDGLIVSAIGGDDYRQIDSSVFPIEPMAKAHEYRNS